MTDGASGRDYLSLKHLDDRFDESGNAGTLDTILALRWIRANIAALPGNPDNETIFRQSGGEKVNALLAAPAVRACSVKLSCRAPCGSTASKQIGPHR